jgi:serine/threonine protein kinase
LGYAAGELSNIEPTPFGEKYVLVEHIATGGMAEVYRAQYTGIEGFAKELVVKCLREEFAARPEIVDMFLDEARVAASLSHNNVVHTYDLGEVYGEYFIAMELLKGEELVQVLRQSIGAGRPMPIELAVGIIMQSLEGLQYAHSRTDDDGNPLGLVHRDINPTNVHVGYDGVCKIVDFGIAATRSNASRSTGQFAGKLSYMAPEQIRGESLDGGADLFALGVVLYEMTLRRRLFRGAPDEVRRRIQEGDVPAPTFVDPSFPPALERIIMRALEPDRAARYQNCDHMFRDLERFMADEGLRSTQRQISAFMSELFGEGAPADVDYDGLYDDLIADQGLDFERFDSMIGADDEAPDWAQVEQQSTGPRRRMTLASLEGFVADVASDDEEKQPAKDKPRASSPKAKSRSQSPRAGAPQRRATSGASRRVTGSRSTVRRPTLQTGVLDTPLAGNAFGQSVMTQQSRGTSPLVWLAVVVVLGALGYFAWTIMASK